MPSGSTNDYACSIGIADTLEVALCNTLNGTIRQISEIRSYHMKITAQEIEAEGNYMLGLVTNTLSVGGFKNLLPKDDISLDDGEFEVLLIQKPTNLVEMHGLLMVNTVVMSQRWKL